MLTKLERPSPETPAQTEKVADVTKAPLSRRHVAFDATFLKEGMQPVMNTSSFGMAERTMAQSAACSASCCKSCANCGNSPIGNNVPLPVLTLCA